jgi:glutathione peroxidase
VNIDIANEAATPQPTQPKRQAARAAPDRRANTPTKKVKAKTDRHSKSVAELATVSREITPELLQTRVASPTNRAPRPRILSIGRRKIWLIGSAGDAFAKYATISDVEQTKGEDPSMESVFDYHATALDGSEVPLSRYAGHVLLIVNTASRCGFTPQYAGLQALQTAYAEKGFSVLGFPCNQFGGQEPGTEAEIGAFCETNYHVTFPLFGKIDVNGDKTHPLYTFLKQEKKGLLGTSAIKWNFTKFLVDRKGQVVERAAPQRKPEDMKPDIETLLAQTV